MVEVVIGATIALILFAIGCYMLVNNMHEGMGGKDGGKRSGDSGGNFSQLHARGDF